MSDAAPSNAPTELEGVAVVVVGNFNPAIFSPAWFRLHNLIGEKEAEDANVQLIAPPAAIFATESISVQVNAKQLILATAMPHEFERVKDTVVGIMTVLNQTPVNAVGLNRESHWQSPTRDVYDAFGDGLASKDVWGDLLDLPGVQDLTIRGVRTDGWTGWVDVTVQPSMRVGPLGLYARVNDHFFLQTTDRHMRSRADYADPDLQMPPPRASSELVPTLLEILRDQWAVRLEISDRILGRLKSISQ